MSAEIIVERLRRFLLLLAGGLCVGTVVELLLVNHREDLVQLVPFALCGIGLVAVVMVLLRPQRITVRALQGVMVLLLAGSFFGIYEHITNNIAFALEIQPNATPNQLLIKAVDGGNPLLAPGVLALAAMIALAATYYHPTLADRHA